jgi:uncharacterized protein (TIGR02246 family)
MRAVLLTLCLAAALPAWAAEDAPAQIRAVVGRMQDAWNRGDFEGYMQGFWNPGVRFVSGGRITTGWQAVLDHYRRDYATPRTRGRLAFCDLEIQMLAPDTAQLVGHYDLERAEKPQHGVNTRLFRKIDGRWVIVLNHVSSQDPPGAPYCTKP